MRILTNPNSLPQARAPYYIIWGYWKIESAFCNHHLSLIGLPIIKPSPTIITRAALSSSQQLGGGAAHSAAREEKFRVYFEMALNHRLKSWHGWGGVVEVGVWWVGSMGEWVETGGVARNLKKSH